MTIPAAWRALASTELPEQSGSKTTLNLPFLQDPLSLLTDGERSKLREDLGDLARQRREAEADNATLRLA